MIIDEAGLVRQMKAAYKKGGYTVLARGQGMTIYTNGWYAEIEDPNLMRKVLAAIVEHAGFIPEEAEAVYLEKDKPAQHIMVEKLADDVEQWTGTDGKTEARWVQYTGITIARTEVFQVCGGAGEVYAVPISTTDLVDPSNKRAVRYGTVVSNGSYHIVAEEMGGRVIMHAIRPAEWTDDRDKWALRLFTALEQVDLHPERDADT